MRKVVVLAALVVAGALLGLRLRSRGAAPAPDQAPAPPVPAPQAATAVRPAPTSAPVAVEEPEPPAATGPPPSTTNGERVVLMSVQSLEEGREDATIEAVVGKVGAGDIDPDEGTVDALLHRLAASGCLDGGDAGGPYRLTSLGRAALLDGSTARPSAAGDAADELASPTTDT